MTTKPANWIKAVLCCCAAVVLSLGITYFMPHDEAWRLGRFLVGVVCGAGMVVVYSHWED